MAKILKWTDALSQTFRQKSGDWVVNRQEVKKYHFPSNIPNYVAEYLFSYKNEDKVHNETHAALLNDLILSCRPQKDEITQFLDSAIQDGSARLFESLDVEVSVAENKHWAHLPLINQRVSVNRELVQVRHPELLKRPMWGILTLGYHTPDTKDGKLIQKGAFEVTEFLPIETASANPLGLTKGFAKIAKLSEQGEADPYTIWFQILLATMFRNPETVDFSDEEHFTEFLNYLTRLAPLIETNVSLIEMGPPGTGKTSGFTQHSPYAMAVPCKNITRAKMFYDQNRRSEGALSHFDCLAIDDIQIPEGWKNIDELMPSLMGYLNPGVIGEIRIPPYIGRADCSVAFLGNTSGGSAMEDTVEYFKNVPKTMREPQFLERINGFIDGTTVRKITNPWDGLALQGDIFGRLLYEIRRNPDVTPNFRQWFKEPHVQYSNVSERCRFGIVKLSAALLKLMWPLYTQPSLKSAKPQEPPRQLLETILRHTIKLRQNVRRLIARADGYQPDPEVNYKKDIKFTWTKEQ